MHYNNSPQRLKRNSPKKEGNLGKLVISFHFGMFRMTVKAGRVLVITTVGEILVLIRYNRPV